MMEMMAPRFKEMAKERLKRASKKGFPGMKACSLRKITKPITT
jgi:hypothetical protein